MTVYVQFSDSKKKTVIAVFSGPQDKEAAPYQGELEEDDPRYLAFLQGAAPQPSISDKIAARRYQAETNSVIDIGGLKVPTSDRTQLKILGAAVEVLMDPGYECNFKTENGFVKLNGEQIVGAARTIRRHVQACFDREEELLQAVENNTYNDAMLEQGWPA